jgi:hypothetical protein
MVRIEFNSSGQRLSAIKSNTFFIMVTFTGRVKVDLRRLRGGPTFHKKIVTLSKVMIRPLKAINLVHQRMAAVMAAKANIAS